MSFMPPKLGISSYSYWHFRGPKYPLDSVLNHAADIGVQGVEILHQQMESEEPSYCNRIKRTAFTLGLDLIALSIHQNFVSPDIDVRQRHVEHTLHCIDLAYRMGIPSIRLNSGRWGTVESFDDLMALQGEEPPLDGYMEKDAFEWCAECIQKCLPLAESCGVTLALENHWGLTRKPEGVLKLVDEASSPWLAVLMDTGNFLESPYGALEKLAPHAVYVHAKTYYGGGEWYTLDLDYHCIAEILNRSGFKGYISLEFEGKEDPMTGVPKSIEMLRAAFM
jgi:sugar phosphate isomerase/epimerase